MTALDFFLYDNRTPAIWGRDWGLKAATGILANHPDLKAAFDRYCRVKLGEQGQLRGFGEAIGGLGWASGYLLCVTLETSDSFGRPSWAVFGIWCPGRATLAQVLSVGDPIGSARALLGVETPPSAIEIRPATVAGGPRRRPHSSAEPVFYRFDPKSTVREVITLLLVAIQQRAQLPNVLGITATSRFAAVAQSGFKLVYCHPMDDRTERELVRVLSPPEPEVEESWTPLVEEPALPPVIRPPRRLKILPPPLPVPSEQRWSISPRWLLWLSVAIIGVGVIFLEVSDQLHDFPSISWESSSPVKREVTDFGATPAPEKVTGEISGEKMLDEVRQRLQECKTIEFEALRQSPGFKAAETVPVLPEYQESRNRVRKAYAALAEIQGRMVKRQGNYVAYYFEEAGKDAAPATRLQKIAEILGEAPLGRQDCGVLKEAFGFEFESGGSVVRRWCDAIAKLEKTAAAVKARVNPALPTPPAPRPAPHAPAAADS
ncbi:MAG TPA: hypothetical protein VGS22_15375 [Thermoanaerobaculia bacterium]|jgi:hypothetical protein|nr:hypothetical protein [Thermoanaerobaculia bacterium]